MANRLEQAASGRAKCRACGVAIEKGSLRFGEELPGTYGDGDGASVFWFHLRCAAERRPEPFTALLNSDVTPVPDREALLASAAVGVAHPRLPRIAGASLAPSGRARCQHCKELIDKGVWRVELSTFGANGFFDPMGFVHAGCAAAYVGDGASVNLIEARVAANSRTPEEAQALSAALRG